MNKTVECLWKSLHYASIFNHTLKTERLDNEFHILKTAPVIVICHSLYHLSSFSMSSLTGLYKNKFQHNHSMLLVKHHSPRYFFLSLVSFKCEDSFVILSKAVIRCLWGLNRIFSNTEAICPSWRCQQGWFLPGLARWPSSPVFTRPSSCKIKSGFTLHGNSHTGSGPTLLNLFYF